jgi:hypothetical protein
MGTKIKIALVIVAVAATVIGALRAKPAVYQLTLIATAPNGQPVPFGQVIIRSPYTRVDGSLCFTRDDTKDFGCVKFPAYELIRIQMQ